MTHSRAERAQLLLITALALAVILVTVALLLNAAIFTENTATRDTTADGHQAIELRGELVDGISELIERENRQDQSHDVLEANIRSSLDETAHLVDLERAPSGEIATLSDDPNDIEDGTLLQWQPPDENRQFDEISTDGTLVEGVTDTRAFELDLADLPELSSPNATQIETEAFGVRLLTSGENVTQYLYVETEAFEEHTIVVATAPEGDDPQSRCTITYSGSTTVDLTGDRLVTDDGQRECYRGLWPDNDPHTIAFVNGEKADGTFAVTVDDGAVTNATNVAEWDAIYSVTVDIGYRSQDLTFETTVRIAPGEPQ